MLSRKEASKLGKRSGRVRKRRLSPEKRKEIASWAWWVREQKNRGEVTLVEQRQQLIALVRETDPDLAALLSFFSRLPFRRAEQIYLALPDEQRELVERKGLEVLGGGDHA
jgi:hypothetical protein